MLFSLNFVKFMGNFVRCLQPINKSEIPRLFFIKSLEFFFVVYHNKFLVSLKSFIPFLKPNWCYQMEYALLYGNRIDVDHMKHHAKI